MSLGKKFIQPPFLKAGDKVALVSPAYWVPEEAIMQAVEIIRSWGLQPVVGPHTTSLNVDAYAGTADERAHDLKWAYEDDSIKAIFCSRGGYGSIHLLNRVPKDYFSQYPKWLIGHGDITTLLYTVAGEGLMSIHGPMAFQISAQQEPATSILRNILFGTIPQYKIPANTYNRCGHAEGVLVGGNLCSYASIIGSKFQIAPEQDVILFIEELEESLHTIDRMFYALRLQENFERVKGIIFGSFSSVKYDLQYGSVEQMLIGHLYDMDIPVCCGFPVGSNSCLPLLEGAPCSLDVTPDDALLSFDVEGDKQLYEIKKEPSQIIK